MAVTVEFDQRVSELAGGAAGMPVTAPTVREALFQVARHFPALRLFNCEGELRSIMRVRRGGAPVALADPVQDGETVRLGIG